MGTTLIFVESSQEKLKTSSLELVTAAKSLDAVALMIGPNSSTLAPQLGEYGIKTVYICDDARTKNYNPEMYTEILNDVFQKINPTTLLASSTALARDFLPRLAAKNNSAVISDCTQLEITADSLTVRRPMYAGKCSAQVEFSGSTCNIVLMRPNQLPVDAPETGAVAEVSKIDIPNIDLKTLIKEVVKGASEKLDLTEANIIVSGGRGMKEPENFKILEQLADVLGATVGASRAVVDAGWVAHDMQVGQTGKTVAPNLYIACGISGAIQHLAGMSESKVIVAINKDPEAPIFQKATYGIVGDVFDVVPKLTEEFKQALS